MKKVLLCTDLTVHSNAAVEYTIELVKVTNAKVFVFHTYFVPAPIGDAAFIPLSLDFQIIEDDDRKAVENICERIRINQYIGQDRSIECEAVVKFSFPTSGIIDEANAINADLIIMGSRGVSGIQKWLGTISSNVANKLTIPILIVPEKLRFTGFSKIIYSTDLKENHEKVLEVIEFAKQFNSMVDILYIKNSKNDGTDVVDFLTFKTKVFDLTNYEKLKFTSISNIDLIPELIEYVKHNDAELLVMHKHHYSFFKNLFHGSVSSQLIFDSEFPLLILH